jgi:hypothetical protein
MMVLLGGAIGTLRKMNEEHEQNDDLKWELLLGMDVEEDEVDRSKCVISKTHESKCRSFTFNPVNCWILFMSFPMWHNTIFTPLLIVYPNELENWKAMFWITDIIWLIDFIF